MAEEKSVKLVFSDGSPEVTLPVLTGSIGPDVIDISTLYKKTGKFTYDPGFVSTASCKSSITYIDGEAGKLLYRGYPIEELADKIKATSENKNRMVKENLVETVKRFNEFCDKKKDEDFARRPETLAKVAQGPFYAMPLVAGGPNTKGGLLADAERRVLDWDGNPIPRLYAIGEIASVLKFVYQGGGNLTECLVYGRNTGKLIAKLTDTKA